VNPWVFCVAHSKDMRGSMIVSEFIGSSFFSDWCAKDQSLEHVAGHEQLARGSCDG